METSSMELISGKFHDNSKWRMLVKRMFWNSSTETQRRNKSLRRKADSIRIVISPPDLPDESAEGSAGGADLTVVANSSIQKVNRFRKIFLQSLCLFICHSFCKYSFLLFICYGL